MLLHSGRYFDYKNVSEHEYQIQDIAHGLSLFCRYTGHCNEFYSVAQHSVLVSRIVPPELAMVGLMHDASEAYLGDVNTHLKKLLPEYAVLEEKVSKAIAFQFHLPVKLPVAVKLADLEMLMTEKRDLMPTPIETDGDNDWPRVEPRSDVVVIPQSPAEAKASFLARYNELKWKGLQA